MESTTLREQQKQKLLADFQRLRSLILQRAATSTRLRDTDEEDADRLWIITSTEPSVQDLINSLIVTTIEIYALQIDTATTTTTTVTTTTEFLKDNDLLLFGPCERLLLTNSCELATIETQQAPLDLLESGQHNLLLVDNSHAVGTMVESINEPNLLTPKKERSDLELFFENQENNLSTPLLTDSEQQSSEEASGRLLLWERMVPALSFWLSTIQNGGNNQKSFLATSLFILSVLVFIAFTARGIVDTVCPSDHTTHLHPKVLRLSQMIACAEELSAIKSIDSEDAPRWDAIKWFWDGPGQKIPIDGQCHDDSDFAQMYALIVLRNAIGLADQSWYQPEINSLTDFCSKFDRISCSDSRITQLTLTTANLTGTLVPELALLPHLTSLQAFSNPNLAGSLPSQLGRLTELQYLALHQTAVTGTIPSELGSLVHLKRMLVDRTFLQGQVPDSICSLVEHDALEEVRITCGETSKTTAQLQCACCDCKKD